MGANFVQNIQHGEDHAEWTLCTSFVIRVLLAPENRAWIHGATHSRQLWSGVATPPLLLDRLLVLSVILQLFFGCGQSTEVVFVFRIYSTITRLLSILYQLGIGLCQYVAINRHPHYD